MTIQAINTYYSGHHFRSRLEARWAHVFNDLGIRWEYTSPVVEVHDRQSNFDIVTGQQLFAGQDGSSRALYDPYYKGFEPRVGFAWTPKRFEDRLVVRHGERPLALPAGEEPEVRDGETLIALDLEGRAPAEAL